MRKINIAILLIKQGDKYLLQLRDGDAKIGAAGLIGGFGGKIESGEAPKAAAVREIAEETSLDPTDANVSEVGLVNVESDHKNEPVQVKAHIFIVEADAGAKIDAKEGKMVSMTKEEAKSRIKELTPATKQAFKEFIWL
jgi:8-oxo-dGTP pyrophosphatase MutT (NUDIX family)